MLDIRPVFFLDAPFSSERLIEVLSRLLLYIDILLFQYKYEDACTVAYMQIHTIWAMKASWSTSIFVRKNSFLEAEAETEVGLKGFINKREKWA